MPRHPRPPPTRRLWRPCGHGRQRSRCLGAPARQRGGRPEGALPQKRGPDGRLAERQRLQPSPLPVRTAAGGRGFLCERHKAGGPEDRFGKRALGRFRPRPQTGNGGKSQRSPAPPFSTLFPLQHATFPLQHATRCIKTSRDLFSTTTLRRVNHVQPLIAERDKGIGAGNGLFAGRMCSDATQVRPAGVMLDEHQDMQPFQQDRIEMQESRWRASRRLGCEELRSRRTCLARCRINARGMQDLPDSGRRNAYAELNLVSSPWDPAVPPQRVPSPGGQRGGRCCGPSVAGQARAACECRASRPVCCTRPTASPT